MSRPNARTVRPTEGGTVSTPFPGFSTSGRRGRACSAQAAREARGSASVYGSIRSDGAHSRIEWSLGFFLSGSFLDTRRAEWHISGPVEEIAVVARRRTTQGLARMAKSPAGYFCTTRVLGGDITERGLGDECTRQKSPGARVFGAGATAGVCASVDYRDRQRCIGRRDARRDGRGCQSGTDRKNSSGHHGQHGAIPHRRLAARHLHCHVLPPRLQYLQT